MRKHALATGFLLALAATPVFALSNEPYLTPGQTDAILLVPPPPPINSELQARDLNDVLAGSDALQGERRLADRPAVDGHARRRRA